MAQGLNPAHYVLIFVNKDLLKATTLSHLHAVYGCFLVTMARVSHCDRDHMTCKAYNTYYLALSETVSTSGLNGKVWETVSCVSIPKVKGSVQAKCLRPCKKCLLGYQLT